MPTSIVPGVDDAERLGLPVRLQVLHANHGAARLYERLGFGETGSTATHRVMRRASAT